jgi:hypothetical protein
MDQADFLVIDNLFDDVVKSLREHVRDLIYRGSFAYVEGATADHQPMPLCRLRYLGSPHDWGFAVYLVSKDGYEDSIPPRGTFIGAPEQALDCACGLYLNDVSAWTDAARTMANPNTRNDS